MKIKFYSDPSHGWAEVPIALINELRIGDKISNYSYMRGSNAYLEEDCDLSTFMNAVDQLNINIEFEDHTTNHDSWIRNLPRWGNP
mgnify:FL=1